jgi:hypothetical protein
MSVPIVVRGGILATNGSALPLDAFDRMRTSTPMLVLSNLNARASNKFIMDQTPQSSTVSVVENVSGAGAGTVTLAATRGENNASAVRQSYQYTPYVPGISKSMMFTAVLIKAPLPVVTAPNVAYTRVGLFDGRNGMFWQYDAFAGAGAPASQISVNIMREGVITQTQTMNLFNVNTLQAVRILNAGGAGSTTAAVDFQYEQVLYIDQEYLGAGSVRFGVYIQDQLIIAHMFTNVNSLTAPYTPSPSAPVRYEATFRGSAGGAGVGSSGTITCTEGCSAVIIEGNDFISSAVPMAYVTGKYTSIPAGERPVLAIRGTNTGIYGDGCKGGLHFTSVNCLATTADSILLRLYKVYNRAGIAYGSVVPTGASAYVNPQPDGPAGSCLVEICANGGGTGDLSSITFTKTGALLLWAGASSSLGRVIASEVKFNFGLALDNVATQLVLTAENMSATGGGDTYDAVFSISWMEET